MLMDLTNGNYYIYQIKNGGCGLVKANSKDEATAAVLEAYHKHGQPDLTEYDVDIWNVHNECFEDSPNVIELGDKLIPYEF